MLPDREVPGEKNGITVVCISFLLAEMKEQNKPGIYTHNPDNFLSFEHLNQIRKLVWEGEMQH